MSQKNCFCLSAAMLMVILAVEHYTDIDVLISDYAYDFTEHRWLITPALHQKLSPFFYEGAKRLVAAIGTTCVIYLLLSAWKKEWRRNFVAVLTVLLSTMIVPSTVSWLKTFTNVYCPNQLQIYEQRYPYVRVLESYPSAFQAEHRGRCFPGGHVTGAFSLMALYLVFQDKKKKAAALGGAVCFGFITGTYQILRGEHFLSHNLFSMFLSAVLIIIIHNAVAYAAHRFIAVSKRQSRATAISRN